MARKEHTAEKVRVQHVLIAFKGADRAKVERSQEVAMELALQLFQRAQKGEDFAALMKYSDDPGGGDYTMTAAENPDPPAIGRKGMVPGFGDVAWRLEVGDIGLTVYDTKASPFGYHIVKRVE